jgi:hypothetical protein
LTAPLGHLQPGAHFGASIASADIDRDGTTDLIVGAPGQDVGARIDQGRVFIFFGPWSPGSSPSYSALTILEVAPVDLDPGNPAHGGRFGFSVAVGDLDRSGNLDVIVGAPSADRIAIPVVPESGAVDVFLDPPRNVTNVLRSRHLHHGVPTAFSHYGWAVALGSFSDPAQSSYADIAVGVPNLDVDPLVDTGEAVVHFGHDDGLGRPLWDSTPGFFEFLAGPVASSFSRTGASLAADDYNADGWTDLAVGAPGAIDSNDEPSGPEGFVSVYDGTASDLLVGAGGFERCIKAKNLRACAPSICSASVWSGATPTMLDSWTSSSAHLGWPC